jgi:hypothetical protein
LQQCNLSRQQCIDAPTDCALVPETTPEGAEAAAASEAQQKRWRDAAAKAAVNDPHRTQRPHTLTQQAAATVEDRTAEDDAGEPIYNDVYPAVITVKTCRRFHASRVRFALESWLLGACDPAETDSAMAAARASTYFVSDVAGAVLAEPWLAEMRAHFVDSGCALELCEGKLCPEGSEEMNRHLSCKTAFEMTLAQNKLSGAPEAVGWWCHVDDDTYVNLEVLADVLRGLAPRVAAGESIYIGQTQQGSNWATGGAGYCIDRRSLGPLHQRYTQLLALHAMSGERLDPDDVLLGRLWALGDPAGAAAGVPRTVTDSAVFHSQFDTPNGLLGLGFLPEQWPSTWGDETWLKRQATFGGHPSVLAKVHCIVLGELCALDRGQCLADPYQCKLVPEVDANSSAVAEEDERERRGWKHNQAGPRAKGLLLSETPASLNLPTKLLHHVLRGAHDV